MRLFDSHAHLTDQRFGSELPDVLARASEGDVESIVTVASDLQDTRAAIDLADAALQPRIWATAGIHPHQADECTGGALDELEDLVREDQVVAVGETGLDFHYENAARTAQLEAFRAQLELAARLGLPVVVHSRSADADMARVVDEHAGRVVGVLHCFTGGPALLEAALAAGWFVSFSGIVTFAKFEGGSHVHAVPADRLLVETDSPYLAPVPRRGKRNEPSYVTYVARRVAEFRGEELEGVAETTYKNACRFYGVPGS